MKYIPSGYWHSIRYTSFRYSIFEEGGKLWQAQTILFHTVFMTLLQTYFLRWKPAQSWSPSGHSWSACSSCTWISRQPRSACSILQPLLSAASCFTSQTASSQSRAKPNKSRLAWCFFPKTNILWKATGDTEVVRWVTFETMSPSGPLLHRQLFYRPWYDTGDGSLCQLFTMDTFSWKYGKSWQGKPSPVSTRKETSDQPCDSE